VDKSTLLKKIQERRSAHALSIETMELTVLESVDSTNNYLRNNYLPNDYVYTSSRSDVTIVVSDTQTQGKGCFGRSWVSPPGINIYCSCQRTLAMPSHALAPLSLVVGLAVVKTLEEYSEGNKLYIKWPNDILYNQAKVAGILIEMLNRPPGAVIIGVGINVNMLENTLENVDIISNITQPWSSLARITGRLFDREDIIASLIDRLMRFLSEFEVHGFAFFLDQWHTYDILFNKPLALRWVESDVGQTDNIIRGIAKGVNAQGQLLIQKEDGQLQAFSSGQASILK